MTSEPPPLTDPATPPPMPDPVATLAAAAAGVEAPTAPRASTKPLTFACTGCGSQMVYAPGTTSMKCPSCGAEQHIDSEHTIVEHSYDAWAKLPPKPVATIGKEVLQCQGCGASTETDDVAGSCQFCGGVLIGVQVPEGLVAPEAVIPFGVDKPKANEAFGTWVKSRWFAPNALKKVGSTEALKGTYIPHWTYDADTQSDYTGERGEHYYTTETFSVSDGKGGSRMESRQVQHTRWYPASGQVSRSFDDVVVPASHQLPTEKLDKMGPWTMASAQPYEPQYLAGYTALRYEVDPNDGLAIAHNEMEGVIRQDCIQDIGGDEQRVSSVSVQYAQTMFKLMLLPLWIASYMYGGKTFQVLINANTGEVIGDRPYSKLKIILTVLLTLVVIGGVVAVVLASKSGSSS
ncbi:MAG: hypothetical protein JWP74_1429 [Marmoricola sp.]|nr:hypothetical protein [Marmoricola sp.]